MKWTPESEQSLAAFFADNRLKLCAEGADAAEVEGDIRRHVDEELRAKGADVVTVEALRRILRDFADDMEPEPEEYQIPRPKFAFEAPPKIPFWNGPGRILGKWSFCLFTIIIPLLTLGIEVIWHGCADLFFDPVPTLWHGLLVALVGITNWLLYHALNVRMPARPRRLLVLGGVAVVVAAYYTVLFLPLYPYAVVGVIVWGIGLLPLASGMALLGTLLASRRLRRRLGEDADTPARIPFWNRAFLLGVLAGVAVLGGLEIPKYLGRAGLHLAASESPATSRFGIAMLRACGSEATVLRACYEPDRQFQRLTDNAGWVFGLLDAVPTEETRAIYYRMTGQAFNAVAPPPMSSRFHRDFWENFQFDEEQGGTAVGARLAKVRAQSSRIDVHLDPLSSLAYTEWTLVFENGQKVAREARFEAQLPPGGVVTRLTLWVNGEPQEAAFGTKSAVRAAYQRVAIQQRRDPVLVTVTGPDRVLVQCFPIPANKGTMKIRLGITSPLEPEGEGKGLAWLPFINERNFNLGDHFEHNVWAQSRSKLESPLGRLAGEIGKEETAFGLRGAVADVDLAGKNGVVRVEGVDPTRVVWSPDPLDAAGDEAPVILREPSDAMRAASSHVYVVLDTSAGMAAHWPDLRESLAKLPVDAPMTLVIADDSVREASGSSLHGALDAIAAEGGKDNTSAILHALSAAAGKPGSAVVWLHAPQPVLLADPEAIAQRFERSFAKPALYDFPLAPGPNQVLNAIGAFTATHAVPRAADPGAFILSLLAEKPRTFPWKYRSLAPGEAVPDTATKVWDHLARYAAFEQVMAAYFGEGDAKERANRWPEFAARHQLVTPFTGAVVLETKEQFEAADLEQISASAAPSIPTIPEPAAPLLLLLASAGWLLRRRR